MHNSLTMKNQLLQKLLQLTQLPKEELESFWAKGMPCSFPAKHLLTKPQQKVDKVYFLKKGILRHYIKGKGGKEFTKNFIAAPHFTVPSLSDFFLQKPSGIYCEAITELEAIEWDYATMIEFAEKNPRMYKFLLLSVVKAFHKKELKEIALNQQDAKTRYIQFMADFPELIHQVPLQYIASYLNIRPETLSRIRAKRIS